MQLRMVYSVAMVGGGRRLCQSLDEAAAILRRALPHETFLERMRRVKEEIQLYEDNGHLLFTGGETYALAWLKSRETGLTIYRCLDGSYRLGQTNETAS
jgi:hypothetical protein